MNGLDRRLKHLEARTGENGPGVAAFILTGVPQPHYDAEDAGYVAATILSGRNKGQWLARREDEPEAEFMERVDRQRLAE
jgi:hypothetical protein